MRTSLRSLLRSAPLLLGATLSGCFNSDTRILGGPGDQDATASADRGTGGGSGGGGGTGGTGGSYPEGACRFETDGRSLDGFEGDTARWSVAGGTLRALPDAVAGAERSLLLRGATETCSDFVADATFTYMPGSYPVLVGRALADGRWYGIGYDGTYRNLVAINGLSVELRDRIGNLAAVDLTPGEAYRMEMRVVDNAVLGMLFDDASERPIAVVGGEAAGLTGPGRIGLFEASGHEAAFGPLSASPLDRGPDGAPHIDSARLIDAQTVHVTLAPAQAVPVTAPSNNGFLLHVDHASAGIDSVQVRRGTASELEIRLSQAVAGNQAVTLTYDAAAGDVQDASQRRLAAATDVAVDNLLFTDGPFEPSVDAFDHDTIDPGWVAYEPEAFSVSAGEVRISATDRYATGAMLVRPLAERHLDSEIEGVFRYDPHPDRQAGRTDAVLALRVRSFETAQYQAALSVTPAAATLAIRFVNGGRETVLASVPVALSAVPVGAALDLKFQAVGPLLSATLSGAAGGGANPTAPIATVGVRDTTLTEPGPAGFTGSYDGTVNFDRVEIRPTAAPPPTVVSAGVTADATDRVALTVLSASPLRFQNAAGFSVWAGDRRVLSGVEPTPDGLALILAPPAIQAGQRVLVRYDPSAGNVTDSGHPPVPLAGFDGLVAQNLAGPGTELAVARARRLTPHTLDVVLTDDGALPVTVTGRLADTFEVVANGQLQRIERAFALGPRFGDTLRLTLAEDLPADAVATVSYTGTETAHVADARGRTLRDIDAAPVADEVPHFTPVAPFDDTFDRPDADMGLGQAWRPSTAALWSLRGGAAVFQGAGVARLDVDAVRPDTAGPRYDLRADVWSSAFDPAMNTPVAWVLGSRTADDPTHPRAIRLGFDFAAQSLYLRDRDDAQTYGPRVPAGQEVAVGEHITLHLRVHGQAVEGEVLDAGGARLSSVTAFLHDVPPPGTFGFAGSAGARVLYFDNFHADAAPEPAPSMLVTDTQLSAEAPNAVLLQVATRLGAAGELLTGGGPEGFDVTVDGTARNVTRVEGVGSGALVHFDGAPVAQRQSVTLGYDDRQGDVHDGTPGMAWPLGAFEARPVKNAADVGTDLFVIRAETVGPWAVDLLLNPQAALPAQVEAHTARALRLRQDGADVPVRDVRVLEGHPDRVRLVLGGTVRAGASLEATYAPGEADARVLDAAGRELQPGYAVVAQNTLEAPSRFDVFTDTFAGPGADLANGWTATPSHDFSRNAGDLVVRSEDPGVEGSVLRPALEAESDLEISTTFRADPAAGGPNLIGVVARSGAAGSERLTVEPESAVSTAVSLVRSDIQGVRLLGKIGVPRLEAGRDHTLRVRLHGPVVTAELTAAGDSTPLGRLLVVDPSAQALPAGQMGLLARTATAVRFHELTIAPVDGYPARILPASARVYTYAPRTLVLSVTSAEPLHYTDGAGFAVTVDGAARRVQDVSAEERQIRVTVAGPDLAAGQTVALSFDPTAGFVYDNGAVPEPLGPFVDLPVDRVEAPVLTAATQVGRNVLALDFALPDGRTTLHPEGTGGLSIEVAAPALGPEPVHFGVDEVWVDVLGDGSRLLLATADDFPTGARVVLHTEQRENARVVDETGTPLADFDTAAPAAARLETDGVYDDRYGYSWNGDDGWSPYAPDGAFQPVADELVCRGARSPGQIAELLAPSATSARDVKVSVDLQIEADTTPYGLGAFPRLFVRAYNDGSGLFCTIRNETGRIPARDAEGNIVGPIDDRGPALVCGRRLDYAAEQLFEGCRMQFFDTVGGAPTVRYDWATDALEPHRLTVSVVGHRLRADLYRLGGPAPVAVAAVVVPDVGDGLEAGFGGVGSGDGGSVRFSNFTQAAAGAADVGDVGVGFAASGVCR